MLNLNTENLVVCTSQKTHERFHPEKAAGPTHLGIIPVRHASVMDMAYWFGGVVAQSYVTQTAGLGGYGIGGYGAVSGYGGIGGYGGTRY